MSIVGKKENQGVELLISSMAAPSTNLPPTQPIFYWRGLCAQRRPTTVEKRHGGVGLGGAPQPDDGIIRWRDQAADPCCSNGAAPPPPRVSSVAMRSRSQRLRRRQGGRVWRRGVEGSAAQRREPTRERPGHGRLMAPQLRGGLAPSRFSSKVVHSRSRVVVVLALEK